jgi:hypothetical protein
MKLSQTVSNLKTVVREILAVLGEIRNGDKVDYIVIGYISRILLMKFLVEVE